MGNRKLLVLEREVQLESLAQAVKYYRGKKGLSQEALGVAVGRSRGWIQTIENGVTKNPGSNGLLNLARELGVDRDELFALVPGSVLPYERGTAAKKEIIAQLEHLEAQLHETIKAIRDLYQ